MASSFLVQGLPAAWTVREVLDHFSAFGQLLPSSLWLPQRGMAVLDFAANDDGVVAATLGANGTAGKLRVLLLDDTSSSLLDCGDAAATVQQLALADHPGDAHRRRHSDPAIVFTFEKETPRLERQSSLLPLLASPSDFPELPSRAARHPPVSSSSVPARFFFHPLSPPPPAPSRRSQPAQLRYHPQLWYVRHASATLQEVERQLYVTLGHNDFWIREQRNRGGFIDFFARGARDEAFAKLSAGAPPSRALVDFGVWQSTKKKQPGGEAAPVVVVDPLPSSASMQELGAALSAFGTVKSLYLAHKEGKPMAMARITTEQGKVVEVGPYPAFLQLDYALKQMDEAVVVKRSELVLLPATQFDSTVAMCKFASLREAELACERPFVVVVVRGGEIRCRLF